MERPALAFAEILLLWIAIAATLVAFWLRAKVAGLLFVPYLAWVTFAAALNFVKGWRNIFEKHAPSEAVANCHAGP